MATSIDSDVDKFASLAHQLVERLLTVDSFHWIEEIAPLTIDLELARQGWQPSKKFENEPAFLIIEASDRIRRPTLPTRTLENLSRLVYGQLGRGITRIAVMFVRQPDESKCHEELLSMTDQGKHSDYHPEIFRQTAIHTLQHWIDAAKLGCK